MNKNSVLISLGITLLFMASCTSRKSASDTNIINSDSVAVMDSMRPDMPPPPGLMVIGHLLHLMACTQAGRHHPMEKVVHCTSQTICVASIPPLRMIWMTTA